MAGICIIRILVNYTDLETFFQLWESKHYLNILLVSPVDESNRSFHITPDLGLGYLAASLRKHEYNSGILHCVKEHMSLSEFEDIVKKSDFQSIGFKFLTYNYNAIYKSASIVKRYKPEVPIILGGIHPTVLPVETMREFPFVDYIIRGEAELSLPLLLDRIIRKNEN